MEPIRTLFKAFEPEFISVILSLPRIYAFLAMAQLFSPTSMPRIARSVTILVLCIPIIPLNRMYATTFDYTVTKYALFFAKEYVLGFLLGYSIGWIFWSVQAAGDLIDNQRGAAIASSIDPLSGHEAATLGNLFSQAFITYFFMVGGIFTCLTILYDSFKIWPIFKFSPIISEQFPVLMLHILDYAVKTTFIIAAPIVAIMFLAEFCLAMISRFAPQIQVFILAMPIKSALAMMMLIFYFSSLLSYAFAEQSTFYTYIGSLYDILKLGEATSWPPIWSKISP